MNTQTKPAALNHALLSRQAIDSSALAVRGVLMHRFAQPGRYEVYASRAGRVVHRELIEVAQDDGATQLDVRLGLPEDEGRCNCGGRSPHLRLRISQRSNDIDDAIGGRNCAQGHECRHTKLRRRRG